MLSPAQTTLFSTFGSAMGRSVCVREIPHLHDVLPAADGVVGPGQQIAVGADGDVADFEEVVALRELVDVQQDFFGRVLAALAARVDGVLAAGFEALVVPVAVHQVRHRGVVLLQAADDFLVELFLERLDVREHGVGVGILRLDVRQHLGVRALVVAQPVVLVRAGAMGRDHLVRLLRGDRRLRHGRRREGRVAGWQERRVFASCSYCRRSGKGRMPERPDGECHREHQAR